MEISGSEEFHLVTCWILHVVKPMPSEIEDTLDQIEPNIKKLRNLKFPFAWSFWPTFPVANHLGYQAVPKIIKC